MGSEAEFAEKVNILEVIRSPRYQDRYKFLEPLFDIQAGSALSSIDGELVR